MPSTTLPVLNGGIVELNTTELTKSIKELAGQVKELVEDNKKYSEQDEKQTQSLEALSKNFSSNRGVSTSQRNAINNASNPTNRAQSLLNLSASGIMRATAGDLRERAIDRFQNNSLVKFGMNAANAYRGFTGRSPAGSRRELTQSQLEDKRENTERQETTNDLLKKILEALSGKGSGVLDPKKEGGIISSILGTIGSALLIPKLLKALGLAAIAGLGAYLVDNAPELRSVIKSIKSFIDIFKTLEMPKGFAGLKTSFKNISTWISETTDKLSKLKLTNITNAFTTNLTKLTDFLKSIKTNIFEKFPKIDKIVTPSFTDKLRAVTTFFKNISNFIKIDDMPSPKIMSGIGTLIKDFGIRFNSVFDSVKTAVSNLKNLIPNLPKSLLPSPSSIPPSVMGQVKSSDILSKSAKTIVDSGPKSILSRIGKSVGSTGLSVANKGLGIVAAIDVARNYIEDDKVRDNLMLGPEEKLTKGQRIRSSAQQTLVNFGFRGVLSLMGLTDINANKLLTAKMAYGGKYGTWLGDLMLLRDIRLGNIDFSNKKTDTSKPTEDNVLSLAERIIKTEEGFEPDPYPDGNGYAVGYGFNFGKENVLPLDSTKGFKSTNERTKGMRFDEKYFYRGDEGKSRALTKLRKIIKERYDRLSANSVFANLAGEGSAVRKAVMLSLAYQVGTDGVLNKTDGYVKMLEAISKGDFDAAGYEIINSDTYEQSPERQEKASKMMKSGILLKKEYPESASAGNIAFSRQRLIVGDYTGVKQNPELTLALSDLRDNAVATVQKMNDKNKKNAIRDIEIQKIAYEKSVELAVKKSLDSEMRIRTAEGRSNGGINGATIPFINNVVDNTQISSINQSVLLKDGPINKNNSYLMLS